MLADLLTTVVIVSVLSSAVRIATPILLAALGELVAERSGIMNLGVEGTMLMGAFAGFVAAYQSGSLVLGILVAMIAGMLMGLLMVFLAATLKVNQTVTGLSLNLLAAGLTLFLYRVSYADIENVPTIVPLKKIPLPILSDIPALGDILFRQNALTYLAILFVPLIALFLYKTRWGLAIRAIGENPRAAETRGLNITRYQYACVLFGGMMSGLGGAFITIGSLANFLPGIIAGRGWLAVILVIAGNWHPGLILLWVVVFSFFDALQLQIQGIGVPVPHQLLLAMPYILALIVLLASRSRSMAPKHLGEPYIRE